MENRFYEISSDDKKSLIESIKASLQGRPDILFAYLHGSFITGHRFRDIDLAVYLNTLVSSSLLTNYFDFAPSRKICLQEALGSGILP